MRADRHDRRLQGHLARTSLILDLDRRTMNVPYLDVLVAAYHLVRHRPGSRLVLRSRGFMSAGLRSKGHRDLAALDLGVLHDLLARGNLADRVDIDASCAH